MAFVSDVKCGKCDRRYSGLRGRCPYCGTRRGKTGKHANQGGNTTGKLIVGLILILLLIAAVVFRQRTRPERRWSRTAAASWATTRM